MITLFDPAQEQATTVENFTPQELQQETSFFSNLLFYAGCTYKAMGQFERANDFFFDAIEAGPPNSFRGASAGKVDTRCTWSICRLPGSSLEQ